MAEEKTELMNYIVVIGRDIERTAENRNLLTDPYISTSLCVLHAENRWFSQPSIIMLSDRTLPPIDLLYPWPDLVYASGLRIKLAESLFSCQTLIKRYAGHFQTDTARAIEIGLTLAKRVYVLGVRPDSEEYDEVQRLDNGRVFCADRLTRLLEILPFSRPV